MKDLRWCVYRINLKGNIKYVSIHLMFCAKFSSDADFSKQEWFSQQGQWNSDAFPILQDYSKLHSIICVCQAFTIILRILYVSTMRALHNWSCNKYSLLENVWCLSSLLFQTLLWLTSILHLVLWKIETLKKASFLFNSRGPCSFAFFSKS